MSRPVFITPKGPRPFRQCRKRQLAEDVKLTSGVNAMPSMWENSLRFSPPLFDDTIPDTQQSFQSSQSTIPVAQFSDERDLSQTPQSLTVVRDTQSQSSMEMSSSRSNCSTQSLLPMTTPLVTSELFPPPTPNDNVKMDARNVADLVLANKKIDELKSQISSLKVTLATNREMLLFRASGRFEIFSNFHLCPLSLNGLRFKSAEHAYQHKKAIFHGRRDIAARVLQSRSPHSAKQALKFIQTSGWHACKAEVMTEILTAKAKQNPVFQRALLNTGNKQLIHNTETDSFWGCGEDFKGLNTLGKILEDLRQSFRYQLPQPLSARPICKTAVSNPQQKKHQSPPARPKPTTVRPKVLVLGNSNTRGIAQGLIDRGLDASGFTLPGGTVSHITSRVRFTKSSTDPECVVLMAGDIEAANGLQSETICARYEHLLKETRRSFPWSRIILCGLPQTGSNQRHDTLRKVNCYLGAVATDERLVEYVNNSNARLRDNIHLSDISKNRLCFNLANLVKKVFL